MPFFSSEQSDLASGLNGGAGANRYLMAANESANSTYKSYAPNAGTLFTVSINRSSGEAIEICDADRARIYPNYHKLAESVVTADPNDLSSQG